MAKRLTATIDKETKQLLINDFGYEPVDLESYTGQIRALKESYNSLQIKDPKDPRLIQLQIAVKDLRADREIEKDETGTLKKTRKRRKDAKSLEQIKAEIDAKEKRPRAKTTKITAANIVPNQSKMSGAAKGIGKSPVAEGSQNILETISENVSKIVETLKAMRDLSVDEAKEEKLRLEDEGREKKETSLEKSKFAVFKEVGSKILKPFQSIFGKILGFIKTVLLGKVLFEIIKWMGDKKNKKSLENIFKFLKTFWPTLLAAYLLFGNSFGKMIVKITASVAKFTVMIVKKLIPKLIAALAKLKAGKFLNLLKGKKGLVAAGLTLTAVSAYGISQMGDDEEEEDTQQFKQGGFVSGPAGPDQVPARLTAGEFVMSKGAVEKYGVNTLAAMNSAGGGTNIPTVTNEYNDGGIVDRSRYYNMMGSPMVRANMGSTMVRADNTQKVNYINGGYVGDSIKVTGDKISNKNIFSPLQNFNNGGLVGQVIELSDGMPRRDDYPRTPKGFREFKKDYKNYLIQNKNTTMQVADTKPTTQVVPPPSSTTNNVVKNYNIEQAQQEAQYSGGGGGNVPKINAEKYISKQKIRTLGITM